MKKLKLFVSALMIALAVLVIGGATVPALQFQAQTMALNAASAASGSTQLFDAAGRYSVSYQDLLNALSTGETFEFFGYEWHVVYVSEGGYATFWMATPFDKTVFNATTRSGNGIYLDGSNIWLNGYAGTTWQSDTYTAGALKALGQSEIRSYLHKAADDIINNKKYRDYKNKVTPGYVAGHNEANADASKKIKYLSYSRSSLNNVTELRDGVDMLTAQYYLTEKDYMWLPSKQEIVDIWGLHANMIQWTETTKSDRAWLRTPDIDNSEYAMAVCAYTDKNNPALDDYFVTKAVKQEAGVRPAIHLNISAIEDEYQDHLANPNKKGSSDDWFNTAWLKALFLVVCVLGLVGIGLVIIAVIVKSRQNKADAE